MKEEALKNDRARRKAKFKDGSAARAAGGGASSEAAGGGDDDERKEAQPFVYHGYRSRQGSDALNDMEEGTTIRKQVALEPNHTHFVLLDDGTTEFPRRHETKAAIEEAICHRHYEDDAPMIQLVVHGGLGTISAVASALERGHPVVVCKDSRGAASLIFWFCQQWHCKGPDALIRRPEAKEIMADEEEAKMAETRREIYTKLNEAAPDEQYNSVEGKFEKDLIKHAKSRADGGRESKELERLQVRW